MVIILNFVTRSFKMQFQLWLVYLTVLSETVPLHDRKPIKHTRSFKPITFEESVIFTMNTEKCRCFLQKRIFYIKQFKAIIILIPFSFFLFQCARDHMWHHLKAHRHCRFFVLVPNWLKNETFKSNNIHYKPKRPHQLTFPRKNYPYWIFEDFLEYRVQNRKRWPINFKFQSLLSWQL